MDLAADDILEAAEQGLSRVTRPVAATPRARRSRSTLQRTPEEVTEESHHAAAAVQKPARSATATASPAIKAHRPESIVPSKAALPTPRTQVLPSSTAAGPVPPPLPPPQLLRPSETRLLRSIGTLATPCTHVCITLVGGSRNFGLTQAATLRRNLERFGACSGDHSQVQPHRSVIAVSEYSRDRLLAWLQTAVGEAQALAAVGAKAQLEATTAWGHVHLLQLLLREAATDRSCVGAKGGEVVLATMWWATELSQRLLAVSHDDDGVGSSVDRFDIPRLERTSAVDVVAEAPAADASRALLRDGSDSFDPLHGIALGLTDSTASDFTSPFSTATTWLPSTRAGATEAEGPGQARTTAFNEMVDRDGYDVSGKGFLPVFFRDNDDRRGLTSAARARGRADAAQADTSFADGSGAAPVWSAAAADVVTSTAPLAASPFLSPAQQRQAAYIDSRKPFACQAEPFAPDGSVVQPAAAGPNALLIAELERLAQVYRATGDKWREYAYSKAVTQIKKMPTAITNVDELTDQRGFGDRIRNKIREILATGSTSKLRFLEATPEVQALQSLTKIWGVGPSTARKLLQTFGISSVEALRVSPAALETLSSAQLVGLQHFEDLLERMPRSEVTAIEAVVCTALRSLRHRVQHPDAEEQALPTADAAEFRQSCEANAPTPFALSALTATTLDSSSLKHRQRGASCVEVVTCGSFRRGKPTSGDVDILLCNRGDVPTEALLACLVDRLRSDCEAKHAGAFAVFDLLTNGMRSHSEVSHSDTWFGVVRLPSCTDPSQCPCAHKPDGSHFARRLDIKLYPASQYPFAIMYFTGSDYFNRSMRLYAQKKGLSLSDKELRPVIRVHGDKVHEGLGIECKTERDIFAALGLPYKTPAQRDIN